MLQQIFERDCEFLAHGGCQRAIAQDCRGLQQMDRYVRVSELSEINTKQ